jgi:hypothetical protein
VQPSPFVTIRCPSCGSGDVRALEHGRFACGHCQSSFLYTGGRVARGPDREPPPSSGAALVVIVSIVLLVFGGAFFFIFFAAGDVAVSVPSARAEAIAVAEAPVPIAVAPPRPTPAVAPPPPPSGIAVPEEPKLEAEVDATPPQLSDYQMLRGCGCPKNIAQLMVLSNGRTTMLSDAGMTITRHLEFAAVGADKTLWRMPITDTSAPAAHYDRGDISMGVGCKNDTMVVAAGMHVSAWSLSKHTLLWSHPLDAPFGKYGIGDGASMGIDCETLRPSKDTVSVRAGKRTVKLALADGAVR